MTALHHVLDKIRQQSPLIHNITNYVVMNSTANSLLAVGASPVMAHAVEEVEDIVSISSALVINMGTLSPKWVESMLLAVKKAKATNTPFVFDPVGVGASPYRTKVAKQLIKAATPEVIRGNASEIMALANLTSSTKGVDSTMSTADALEGAKKLAETLTSTIVVSGATDYIVTGNKVAMVDNGSPLMAKVTGMGCTATAIVGACIAVEPDVHQAAKAAMVIMGVTGDLAASKSAGPGSFQVNFYDSLYNLTTDDLQRNAKLK